MSPRPSTHFRSIAERFSFTRSLRRTSSSSWDSARSAATVSSTASAINYAISRVPSIADLEEERRRFPSELSVLEPRPIVYWESMEGKMGSLNL